MCKSAENREGTNGEEKGRTEYPPCTQVGWRSSWVLTSSRCWGIHPWRAGVAERLATWRYRRCDSWVGKKGSRVQAAREREAASEASISHSTVSLTSIYVLFSVSTSVGHCNLDLPNATPHAQFLNYLPRRLDVMQLFPGRGDALCRIHPSKAIPH